MRPRYFNKNNRFANGCMTPAPKIPSPIQTILSAPVFHWIHRLVMITARVTSLEAWLYYCLLSISPDLEGIFRIMYFFYFSISPLVHGMQDNEKFMISEGGV